MSLRQIQRSIAQWGRETFGRPGVPPPPTPIAARMNVEVAELLVGLAELDAAHVPADSLDRAERVAALLEECADIGIMLVQVADALGGDLEEAMDNKMAVNRARTWARTPSGKVQHVDGPVDLPFKEEGSGLMMELDKWYVLSDSGSAYTSRGFESAADALIWARSPEGRNAGAQDAVIPPYRPQSHCWLEQDGANILLGRDLFDFWLHNPLSEAAEAQA